jgi:hypothetical protein
MAELFEVSGPTINEPMKNMYETGEIRPKATFRIFRIVQKERDCMHVKLRNLSAECAKPGVTAYFSALKDQNLEPMHISPRFQRGNSP